MLLRLEEVATRLGISYTAARAMTVEGVIPSFKVGERGIRVESEELEKYIAKQKEEAK